MTQRSGALLFSKQPCLYVDIASGEPLFADSDKCEAGCDWPSFTKPVRPANVSKLYVALLGTVRTEVRSTQGDSHLGRVINGGPNEQGGLLYCINPASSRFIPREDMEAQGHGVYLSQVKEVG